MEELTKITFSIKSLFIPLTTKKAVLFIIIVGFIVYFNMLFNGFVWDDTTFIINNPDVHSVHIRSLFGRNMFNNEGQYRPLTAAYFSVVYAFFKDTPITQLPN